MPTLRYAGPRTRPVREPVSLHDRHPVGVPGQNMRREHPREAPAHHYRVPPTPVLHAPTIRSACSTRRVHQAAPLIATSREGTSIPLHREG